MASIQQAREWWLLLTLCSILLEHSISWIRNCQNYSIGDIRIHAHFARGKGVWSKSRRASHAAKHPPLPFSRYAPETVATESNRIAKSTAIVNAKGL